MVAEEALGDEGMKLIGMVLAVLLMTGPSPIQKPQVLDGICLVWPWLLECWLLPAAPKPDLPTPLAVPSVHAWMLR